MSTNRPTAALNALRRWDLIALGAVMLLAIGIRARGIGTTNLWLDEANSWLLTTYSVGDMLANIRHSPASPLYFLLLKLWTLAWGDSAAALRSFSLMASLLLLPLVYVLGRETIGRAGGVVAALLLALSPLQLYFAQEARVYMLATLLSTLATAAYLAWRAEVVARLRGAQGGRRADRYLWFYVVAAIASLYTLPLVGLLYVVLTVDALHLLAVQQAAVTPETRRAIASRWAVGQVVVALACMPLVLTVDATAAASSQAWRGPMGVVGSARNFLEFFMATIHGLYFYPWDLFPAIADKWERAARVRLVVVFPLTILALVTAFTYPPRRAPRVLYWALLVPLAVGTVISVWHELALTRYLLFVSPYLCLLIAGGIARAPRWLGAGVLAALVCSSVYGLLQYGTITARDSDFRPTAALLADSARSGLTVVVQPPEAGVQLAYYLRDKRDNNVSFWGMRAGAAADSALRPAPGQRTWLVLDYRSRWYDTPPDSLDKTLAGTVMSDRKVGSGERRVRLIEVANASPGAATEPLPANAETCCGVRPPR